uniref:Peptide-methionine (R)-S-oxide reductase n=1 Tax=Tetraselmis sp. GSL018 TaxID=582737 RepID=A0A061RAK1_9CHLO
MYFDLCVSRIKPLQVAPRSSRVSIGQFGQKGASHQACKNLLVQAIKTERNYLYQDSCEKGQILKLEFERRSILSGTVGLFVSAATSEADASEPDQIQEAAAPKGAQGMFVKAGKLGAILIFADLVTGAVLGKSAFDIFQGKTQESSAGWKEKLADRILGTQKQEIEYPVKRTDEEWKSVLTPMEYRVLRLKGTEPPSTGEYDKYYPESGYFKCAGCGNPLYSAEAKFDSGCGWPAFDRCYEGSIVTKADTSLGMRRVEILCASCGGHLGHVFEGEGFTPTNERHCVNSASIKFDGGAFPAPQRALRQ